MIWQSTPFEPINHFKDKQGNPYHLLLLMSDEGIYEAEYLPHTEEFYIFSRQETIPVTSPRIEHWTYALYSYTTASELPRPEEYYNMGYDEDND